MCAQNYCPTCGKPAKPLVTFPPAPRWTWEAPYATGVSYTSDGTAFTKTDAPPKGTAA